MPVGPFDGVFLSTAPTCVLGALPSFQNRMGHITKVLLHFQHARLKPRKDTASLLVPKY